MDKRSGPSSRCLPGVYPSEDLPLGSPDSERRVFKAVRDSIPKNWYAWHSLKIRIKNGRDGECDFVVADPARGLLLLEVKGGYLQKKHGQWYQNKAPLLRSPSSQAKKFRQLLRTKFQELEKIPPPIGIAVCFPDTPAATQPTQGDLDGRIIGSSDLPYLDARLPTLFIEESGPPHHKIPHPGWIKTIHTLWCDSWIPALYLSIKSKDFIDRRLRLNTEQFCALCSILENDRVLVLGGAGTGKTLLARELAIKEADSGRRVLLLTFTGAVGLELKHLLGGTNITASHIGRFAVDLLEKRGAKLDVSTTQQFWEETTIKACKTAIPSEDEKWDTVIVDEGQDMGEYEWILIWECANSTKRIWVFADSCQAFWENKTIPDHIQTSSTKYRLHTPFRCPEGIQNLANAYAGLGFDPETIDLGLKRGEIKIIKAPAGEIHKRIGHEIDDLIAEGFGPNDIAVISLRGMQFPENIMHQKSIDGYPIYKATDPEASSHVVCDTFLRFKGLERPAVIVTDLRYVTNKYQTRMNIAVSRSMGVLRIVGAEEEIEKDKILAGFC